MEFSRIARTDKPWKHMFHELHCSSTDTHSSSKRSFFNGRTYLPTRRLSGWMLSM